PVAMRGFLGEASGESRRHLPRRGMTGDEAREEIPHIGAERAHPVAALLYHEGRIPLLADQVAELLEITRAVRPGAWGVAACGIEARTDNEKSRSEAADAAQSFRNGSTVLIRGDVLGQRNIQIVPGAGANARLVAEAGEIGIGEARVTVDRYGKHIGPDVENLLLAVAVVIVDVENGDPAVAGQEVGSDRTVVEIAEAAEGACLGMMPRRAYQGIGEVGALEHLFRCGECAIDGRAGGEIGIQVERRESVYAVIAGKHRLVLRRPRRVPRGEHIGV